MTATGSTAERARGALREWFGHDDFLGPQLCVIEHLVAGGDALVIMPTGGGKSLCYQLPALLSDGVTVVLSPLIALMQDQVDQLVAKGIPATFINSSLSRKERDERLAGVVAGAYKLLYVTPERFRKEPFVEQIRKVNVPLLAVDEAHCVSAWGHDFRPDYSRLVRIRQLLGDPPTIALTATATLDTQADIRDKLGIEDARLFHTGIERPNLFVGVREVQDDDDKFERIRDVVSRVRGPGIIYMALIKDLVVLQERLLRAGFDALVYHGDLPARDRRRTQRAFLESDDALIVATNAFGMGVDKPDIRFILHGQIPGSVEAYYQEIGRAGRDGGESFCELLYAQQDLMIQKQFVEWANPDGRFVRDVYNQLDRWGDSLHARDLQDLRETLLLKNRADGRVEMALGLLRAEGIVDGSFQRKDLRLVRELAPREEDRLVEGSKRERDLRRLLQIVEYARDATCRKQAIHGYFGFEWEEDGCGACDRCVEAESRLERLDGPRALRRERGDDADGAPVSVGDWIVVKDRFRVTVKSIDRQKGEWIAQGQSADDLRIRSYNLSRVTWRPMEVDA